MPLRLRVSVVTRHCKESSPPTPAFCAARPVITPRDVVRMLTPRPPSTARHAVAAGVDTAAGTAHALDAR